MKIALAQISILYRNRDKMKEKCEKLCQDAIRLGVELLVFPEMTLTGFDVAQPDLDQYEEDTITFFEQLSKKYALSLLYGYAGKGKEKMRNKLRLIQEDQTIIQYEKIHPFSYGEEAIYYEGGEKLCIGRIKDFFVSAVICYDLRFPEIFQILSDHAACIFVIANWPASRSEAWQTLLKARAIENQCYIAAVNMTGECNGLYYEGLSAVYGPDGKLIAGNISEEGLIVADIYHDNIVKIRKKYPFKKDHNKQLYMKLMQENLFIN